MVSFDDSYFSHLDELIRPNYSRWFGGNTIKFIVTLTLLTWIGGYVALEYFYFNSNISITIVHIVNVGVIVGSLLFFLIMECIKSGKFTGMPYLNDTKKQRSLAIKKCILRFFFGQLILATLSTFLIVRGFQESSYEDWMTGLIDGNGVKVVIIYIVISAEIVLCELYPIYFALDSTYLKVLSRDGSHGTLPLMIGSKAKVDTFFNSSVHSRGSSEISTSMTKMPGGQVDSNKISLDLLNLNYVAVG